MDQLRVGVRRGMMMWGRERLAEGFYDSAVAEMSKPNADKGKALWNLNAATNLNPKFIEAIDLKQQITSKELSIVDNSISRKFVRDMILTDLARSEALPSINASPEAKSTSNPEAPKEPEANQTFTAVSPTKPEEQPVPPSETPVEPAQANVDGN